MELPVFTFISVAFTYQHNCFKRYFHFLLLSFSTQTAKWTLIEVRAIDIEFIARDSHINNNNNINSYNEKKCAHKKFGIWRFLVLHGAAFSCKWHICLCKVYNERIAMHRECVFLLSYELELENRRQTILASKHAKSVTCMCTLCGVCTCTPLDFICLHLHSLNRWLDKTLQRYGDA